MSSGGMTQQTAQEVDPDVKDRQMQLYADTQNYLANTGYTPYGQAASYGMDPMSQQAQNYLSQQITGTGYNFTAPPTGAPYQGEQFTTGAPRNAWRSDGQNRSSGYGLPPAEPYTGPTTPQRPSDPTGGENTPTLPVTPYGGEGEGPYEEKGTRDRGLLASSLMPVLRAAQGDGGPGTIVERQAPPFQGVGARENQLAAQAAEQGMYYNPQQVQAGQGVSQQVGPYSADTTAGVNAQNVSAQTGAQGMQGYQNAYQNQVIDQGINDILRASQIQDQYRNQSGGAGVYGGDRHGIREAETDRATGENVSRFVNQARSQGFNTAAGLAQQDASRGLQAQGMNQGAGLQAQLANQGALNQGGQFNANLGMQGALANQQAADAMGRYNLGLGLQGQMANQQAGLAGAGQRLGAANALSGIGTQQLRNVLSGAGAMNQMGMQNTMLGQDMINRDMDMYNLSQNAGLRDIGTLQSVLQGMPVGMNSTQTNSGGSLLSGLGGGLLSLASMYPGFGGG